MPFISSQFCGRLPMFVPSSFQDIVLYDVMIAIIRVIFMFINNNIPILPSWLSGLVWFANDLLRIPSKLRGAWVHIRYTDKATLLINLYQLIVM
jgi:hypothetical protein